MTDRHFESVQRLARDGGALALDHFHRLDELTVTEKSRNDLVSDADRGVEMLLRNAIMDQFPDDGILGEEYGHDSGASGITWVIDPIDGTANFVRGRPHWCVSIACVEAGRIIAGCIYDPVHDEMYFASATTASTRNGRTIHVTDIDEIDLATVGIGLKPAKGESEGLAMLTPMVEAGTRLYRNSSGALSLAYVADGRLDAYVESHMHSWDFMAGALIVRQAGGVVRDFDVPASLTNGAPVIASNGRLDLMLPPAYS
ncbi:MAG: inositol monophosphatase family protein [Candidatus Puniceispirillaceae bacterium]